MAMELLLIIVAAIKINATFAIADGSVHESLIVHRIYAAAALKCQPLLN